MPSDFRCVDECDVYVTVYWGRISLVDILRTISQRAQDPDVRAAKASIIDVSEATWVDVPTRYLHDEAERLRPAFGPPKMHTVFVAADDVFYGLARMYAIVQVVYGGAKVDVVRTWADAAQLLGADLAPAERWAKERAAMPEDDATRERPTW